MKKKVVVTGGEGFIGQHLINRIKHDYNCWSIDLKPFG